MELFPNLEIGFHYGWILLGFLYLTQGLLLLTFPKAVVARLFEYDRSKWSKKHRIYFVIGKSLAFVCLILIIFTPLKTESNLFIPGIVTYALGMAGFSTALIDYKNTPLDRPVTQGIYRITRHPQVFSLFILTLGICMATGSWLVLFMLVLSALFNHSRNLEEEKACLERYGESYSNYMKRVRRYFLF
jgi:protein-S-isoprenylcysteine O-methyltransferase Ste14